MWWVGFGVGVEGCGAMADLKMATGHLLLPLCEKMVSTGARIEGVLTVNCSSVINRPLLALSVLQS